MSNAFVIGNGESRKEYDLNKLKGKGKIYGCNGLYREFTPDALIAVDSGISHEIYNSGYCQENETYLRGWTRLPSMLYDSVINAGASISAQEMAVVKENNMINANEKGDCQEFVMHGSNISGAVKIIQKDKSITDKNVNHTAVDVSWCTMNSKEQSIDDVMTPRDWGFGAGATAGAIAIIQNQSTVAGGELVESLQLFLIGNDLATNDKEGKINNLYKDSKYYGVKDQQQVPTDNWITQWKSLIVNNPNVTFYKVNPKADLGHDAISRPIKEWEHYKNVFYIDYETMETIIG
jgi:hypothetical protein|tara:strand:- start:5364 stop:6239 length:876 start_codon:yes stop_codon:yes gene_type:complete